MPYLRRVVGCSLAFVAAAVIVGCTTFSDDVGVVEAINPLGKAAGAACTTGEDCKSDRCEKGTCAVQLPGAAKAKGTDPANLGSDAAECKSHADCKTGCGDDGKCASAPSCTQAHGGRSCGADGKDDCCAVAKQGSFTVDKYMITAGRMRAFVERFDGNIKGFVEKLPADKWKPSWTNDDVIPGDVESANVVMGPYKKKACSQGPNTGHTYWTSAQDDPTQFDQATLDEKALNCVPWAMLQALCIWDGGHLATVAELKAAFTNGGTTKYPWGNSGLSNLGAPDREARLNLEYAYVTEGLPTGARNPPEVSFFISPPGRFPNGNNKVGIADSAGNLLEWAGDRERQFVWKGDFEHHVKDAAAFNLGYFWWDSNNGVSGGIGPWIWGTNQLYGNAGRPGEEDGYYAIGGRCAH